MVTRHRVDEAIERNELIAAVAAASADEMMKKYLTALERLYNAEVLPDLVSVPPSADVTTGGRIKVQYNFEGVWRLGRVSLMAAGGTFPSVVSVIIERISHLGFPLTAAKPEMAGMKFQLVGGSDMTFINADPVNAGMVYLEWEKVR